VAHDCACVCVCVCVRERERERMRERERERSDMSVVMDIFCVLTNVPNQNNRVKGYQFWYWLPNLNQDLNQVVIQV
jgi:hypothetical protein